VEKELSLWERMDRTKALVISIREELDVLRDFKD